MKIDNLTNLKLKSDTKLHFLISDSIPKIRVKISFYFKVFPSKHLFMCNYTVIDNFDKMIDKQKKRNYEEEKDKC